MTGQAASWTIAEICSSGFRRQGPTRRARSLRLCCDERSDTADVEVAADDLMAKRFDDGPDRFESVVVLVRDQHLQAMFRLERHHASPMMFRDPTLSRYTLRSAGDSTPGPSGALNNRTSHLQRSPTANWDGANLDAQAESGHPGWPIFRPTKEEPMPASITLPEHHDGAIRVVSETAQIVAVCLEGDFDLTNAPALDSQINRSLDGGTDLNLGPQRGQLHRLQRHPRRRARRAVGRSRKQTIVLQLGTAAIVERFHRNRQHRTSATPRP